DARLGIVMNKTRKSKSPQGTPRGRLSAAFLESLETDFEAHRDEVIEALRKESPKAYAELVGRLIATTDPPAGESFKDAKDMKDIGRRLLRSCGFLEPDEMSIAAAIEANNAFVSRLEAIVEAAGIKPETMN